MDEREEKSRLAEKYEEVDDKWHLPKPFFKRATSPNILPWPFQHFVRLHPAFTDNSAYFITIFLQLHKSFWRPKKGVKNAK